MRRKRGQRSVPNGPMEPGALPDAGATAGRPPSSRWALGRSGPGDRTRKFLLPSCKRARAFAYAGAGGGRGAGWRGPRGRKAAGAAIAFERWPPRSVSVCGPVLRFGLDCTPARWEVRSHLAGRNCSTGFVNRRSARSRLWAPRSNGVYARRGASVFTTWRRDRRRHRLHRSPCSRFAAGPR